jgi:Zn-dependent protease with chaperone function
MAQQGQWFDGQVATERSVTVAAEGGKLVITGASGSAETVDPAELVRMDAGPGRQRFGHRSIEGWRLVLAEPYESEVIALLPRRAGSVLPVTNRTTVAILSTISVVATALMGLIIFAPETVARHMPMSWERKIGAAYDLPVEAMRCDNRQADAALMAMIDRLDPRARADGFTIELLDMDESNAAALPGGRMVVLNGLFDDLENPDAVAGIVAHEIAHVRRRHVAAGMVRELGLGTVITLLGGGAVAANAGGLLSLKFSRTAEAEADADAIAMLRKAGIDPRPTAAAFEQFRRQEGDFPEWMGSHPASGGRARTFAASFDPKARYSPSIDPAAAKALKGACRG